MLIDLNAYVGHWPFKQLKYNTCRGLLDRMDQFGVDQAVVSNLNGIFYKNTQAANEELHEEMQSSRAMANRLIPFCVINPIYAGWKDDLKICRDRFGMKGVRIYPQYHDYQVTDPALTDLVRMARDSGLAVALSLRMVDSRQRSWMDITGEWTLKDVIPLIREVPDARYLILNVANSMRLTDDEMEVLQNAEWVMDLSGREIVDFTGLFAAYGYGRFAFGTHAPILDYATALVKLETLRLSEASAAVREQLSHENAKRILGI